MRSHRYWGRRESLLVFFGFFVRHTFVIDIVVSPLKRHHVEPFVSISTGGFETGGFDSQDIYVFFFFQAAGASASAAIVLVRLIRLRRFPTDEI
jgi:glycerol uptake facilitator-like aquaporin